MKKATHIPMRFLIVMLTALVVVFAASSLTAPNQACASENAEDSSATLLAIGPEQAGIQDQKLASAFSTGESTTESMADSSKNDIPTMQDTCRDDTSSLSESAGQEDKSEPGKQTELETESHSVEQTDLQGGTKTQLQIDQQIDPQTDSTTTENKPIITGYVVISGNTRVGSMLVAGVEGAPENVLLNYQWYRGDLAIAQATTTVYYTVTADAGFDITCRVTALNYEGALVSGAIKPTAPPESQAFAVYSDTDKSLSFYKRPYVPNTGDTFAGKAVTAIYTGIETTVFAPDAIPWSDYALNILSVQVVDEVQPLSTAYWFSLGFCTEMDLRRLNTSRVTDMEGMFLNCAALTSLDVGAFDTSNVTNMSWMFCLCDNLTALDLSSWDTSNVADMSFMFWYSYSLESIDVSRFNTAQVTDFTAMFESCWALTSINMSNWDTSRATSFWEMFTDCQSLTMIDVSNFNASQLESIVYMFAYCPSLTTVYVASSVDWSSVAESDLMFSNSPNLVGGLGTKFEAEKDDAAYALVDGLDGRPGYFTPKITVGYFDSETGTVSNVVLYVYGLQAAQSSLEGFCGWALAPNASSPSFLPGDVITYDPANIGDIVLYPVIVQTSSKSVVISGETEVGKTLVATLTGAPSDVSFSYQWYRDGVAIDGATSTTYALVRADAKHNIVCKVMVSDRQIISNTLGPIVQMITVEYWSFTEDMQDDYVKVKEVATDYDSFSFDASAPNEFPGYSFDEYWSGGFCEIVQEGWTADQFVELYELEFAQPWDGVSAFIVYASWNVKVYRLYFADDNGVFSSVVLNWYSAIEPLPLSAPAGYELMGWFTEKEGGSKVNADMRYADLVANDDVMEATIFARLKLSDSISCVISGETEVGKTLTAALVGVPSGASFSYQWYRDGVAIDGATSTTYDLVSADGNACITCRAEEVVHKGALTSNVLGPVVHWVTVQYWSYTESSPYEYTIIRTMTANLYSVFDHAFDQNKDDDITNDYIGFWHRGWADEGWIEYYDSSIPVAEFTTTLDHIAAISEWDGVAPINVYSYLDLRYIEVTYITNGYELSHDIDPVKLIAWTGRPCLTIVWLGHKLIDLRDDQGNSINEDMTCGYILTELLGTPYEDVLNIHLIWEETEYYVNFVYPNGYVTTVSHGYADKIVFPDPGNYADQSFAGWFTEANGAGKQVQEGTLYCTVAVYDSVEEISLYAYFVSSAKQAFAVYAEEDNSLRLYNRAALPSVGEVFESRVVTALYTGFESKGAPWKDIASVVESVIVVDQGIQPTTLTSWFAGFVNCTHIDLAKLDTSEAKYMARMFEDCASLIAIDVSSFNTAKVISMAGMFMGCSKLVSLDLSSFDTSYASSMTQMFRDCTALVSLDLSNFTSERLQAVVGTFRNCSSLVTVDISGFDSKRLIAAEWMFAGCSSLNSIYVAPEFDMSDLERTDDMFEDCLLLAGGEGTAFNPGLIDGTYARADGVNGEPGYFTAKTSLESAQSDLVV